MPCRPLGAGKGPVHSPQASRAVLGDGGLVHSALLSGILVPARVPRGSLQPAIISHVNPKGGVTIPVPELGKPMPRGWSIYLGTHR